MIVAADKLFRKFLRKFQPVVIGAVQIFESLQQNCLIFAKILPRDNRGRHNFQVTSTKLPYFCENLPSWYRSSSNIQVTSSGVFLLTFELVIIGAVQIFK